MFKLTSFLFSLLIWNSYVFADSPVDKFVQEENVLVLKSDNFEDALQLDYVLVEFYAPWCGHCKALAPEFAAAATQLRNDGSNIYLAKVDATQETELAERFEVRGYPTLKLFSKRKGAPIEYSGGRTSEQIIKWLLKKTGPPAQTLATVEEAKKFTETNVPVSIVGFFSDVESAEAKAYLDAAIELDDYAFGLVTDKDVMAGLEVTKDGVVLFKNFDEKRNDLQEEITKDQIKKFIAQNSLPLVVEFSHQTAQKIFGGDVKAHNLLFISKAAPESEKIIEGFRNVAKEYKNKVLFVTINSDVEDHERIMEFFGLKKDAVPELRLIKLEEEMTKFKPPTRELDEVSIKTFVDGVLEGSIKQHLLSQELPEDWDKNPVKVLVSTNFDTVALDKTKDVLVEFYAPWCGHCKQLEPIYNQLGEKFASNENVVVAKMDATANELEHTKISSFPTIKLYKKETNDVVEFNGDRTLEALSKFIETSGKEGASPKENEEDEEEEKAEDGAKKDEL